MTNVKNSLIYFLLWPLAAWSFLICAPSAAVAPDESGQEILDYTVAIQLKTDGTAAVAEKITLPDRTATNEDRLLLPARYVRRGWLFQKQLSGLKITDAAGEKLSWRAERINGQKTAVITSQPAGAQTRSYTLSYILQNFFTATSNGARLDWPAIRPGWPVDILQAKVTISLPAPSDSNKLSFSCQTNGGQPKDCLSTRLNYTAAAQSDKIIFAHDRLPTGTGLDISLTLPSDQLLPSGRGLTIYIIAFLLAGAAALLLFRRRGRNKKITEQQQ